MYPEGLSENPASPLAADCQSRVHLGNPHADVNELAARYVHKYASYSSHRQVLVRDIRMAAAQIWRKKCP